MVEYYWPKENETSVLGKEHDRIDGIEKSTGAAKYSYDINPANTLVARLLGSPKAHAKIKSIDCSPATKVPGVVVARPLELIQADVEVNWHGEPLAVVVAETEGAAAEGLRAIKIEFEDLDVYVDDADLEAAEAAGRTSAGGSEMSREHTLEETEEDDMEDAAVEKLFAESDGVIEGRYGIHAITHMCLEPHGSICEWQGDKLTAHLSTQNVSGTPAQFAGPLGITADDVTVHCDFIGGGFGSKFAADAWGVEAARLARETGRPVKLMLDRDTELQTAGCRPSGFMDVKVGFDSNGRVKIWDSHQWGTNGHRGNNAVGLHVIPYVFSPNLRKRRTTIATNTSPDRAWRAPHHPQGCAMSQTVYDDIARHLGKDSFDVFMENLPTVSNKKEEDRKDQIYADQMRIAADLIGWKDKWHPHGKGSADGSVVTGLGMAIHTWGGAGHPSSCSLKIHPDGGVEISMGSQDLGTGTRTVLATVVAETLGLPLSAVKVNIGSSKYPQSGASGGSTTVGGISESSRRASQDALASIFGKVAAKLEVGADELEAKNGRIQKKGDANTSVSWKQACSMLGMQPLEVQGVYRRGGQSPLSNSGVAGVQMAEVAVDRDTGVVKMKKFVAVQDMGLIISPKTAASQIYGAVIMGIAFALFEERIMDPVTGWFVNTELSDYKLPRLGDTGDIIVHLYEPESERNRGVIGLGEPPVISPGAAISNAVCNALGVRVPILPMTPMRVLNAIEKARNA